MGALPPDGRGLRLLGAEPADDRRRSCARSRRRSARRRWPATAAAPTSTTRTASTRTARRGSRRPRSAARWARSARTPTATPTATCSPTRRTGSGPPSRRSSPARPSSCSGTRSSPDAAGPGAHRGGASLMRDSLWLQPAEHHLMSIRYKRASGSASTAAATGRRAGSGSGDPAADGTAPSIRHAAPTRTATATPVAGVLDPRDERADARRRLPLPVSRALLAHAPLSVLRYVNNGGGGWGDPFQRDPELVKRDVRDGYVTIEGAARDYGVVVAGDPEEDPEGLSSTRRRPHACATSGLPGERRARRARGVGRDRAPARRAASAASRRARAARRRRVRRRGGSRSGGRDARDSEWARRRGRR